MFVGIAPSETTVKQSSAIVAIGATRRIDKLGDARDKLGDAIGALVSTSDRHLIAPTPKFTAVRQQ